RRGRGVPGGPPERDRHVRRDGFADPYGWPGFELAGALARQFWGQGYATEAGQIALAYAFTVLGKDHVISLIHPENQASIRAAERLGETLQGRTELMGEERLVYGIDREGYLGQLAITASAAEQACRPPAAPRIQRFGLPGRNLPAPPEI
ncbi:MAG TPA: GNAT family N-acetyltransferase, partial [Thermoanaerobaculia bacterium]|nr:GNAT family N-acetyltransferase [Thermoanaerobaculia bacterium]